MPNLKAILAGVVARVVGLVIRKGAAGVLPPGPPAPVAPAVIPPTVGRVVWFYPLGHVVLDQPVPAIVTHVWSDALVNLVFFTPFGDAAAKGRTSVTLLQGDQIAAEGSEYCRWMPYQKGQAAKTEALEKQLAKS